MRITFSGGTSIAHLPQKLSGTVVYVSNKVVHLNLYPIPLTGLLFIIIRQGFVIG